VFCYWAAVPIYHPLPDGMSQVQTDLLPHDNAVGEIYKVNISFIAVTSLIIGLRLVVRGFVVKHVAVDDYLMVAAGLFSTAFSAMTIVGKSNRCG
jgi:hypothetical protein